MSFISIQISIFLLSGWLVTSSLGIDCFVCKSEQNSKCTESQSSGPPIAATNCSNTDTLIKGWITKHDFMKKGLGEVTLEKIVNFFDDQASKAADLKVVTACAYFYASSENVVTEEVDKDIAKGRSFFGDKKANDPVTIHKWVMRDCTTVKIRQEIKDSVGNKCFPVSGIKDLAKLHFCTCTSDKCNLPSAQVRSLIIDSEANGIEPSIFLSDSSQLLLPTVISVLLAITAA